MFPFAMELNRIDARTMLVPPPVGGPIQSRTASPANPSSRVTGSASGGVTFGTLISFQTPAFGYASLSTDRSSPSAAFPSSGLSTGMQPNSAASAQQALLEEILALRVALLAAYASFAQQQKLALLLPKPLPGPFGTPAPRLGPTIAAPAATPGFASVQQAYASTTTPPQALPGGSVSLISILA